MFRPEPSPLIILGNSEPVSCTRTKAPLSVPNSEFYILICTTKLANHIAKINKLKQLAWAFNPLIFFIGSDGDLYCNHSLQWIPQFLSLVVFFMIRSITQGKRNGESRKFSGFYLKIARYRAVYIFVILKPKSFFTLFLQLLFWRARKSMATACLAFIFFCPMFPTASVCLIAGFLNVLVNN